MSALIFMRSIARLGVARRNSGSKSGWEILGVWPAHNEAASTSKGPWPIGVYLWSHYNAHDTGLAPACMATAYGCNGIHIFDVSAHGRSGMGVHAGRVNRQTVMVGVGGKTLGCIRVPEEAMQKINQVHSENRLEYIVVLDHKDDQQRVDQRSRGAIRT